MGGGGKIGRFGVNDNVDHDNDDDEGDDNDNDSDDDEGDDNDDDEGDDNDNDSDDEGDDNDNDSDDDEGDDNDDEGDDDDDNDSDDVSAPPFPHMHNNPQYPYNNSLISPSSHYANSAPHGRFDLDGHICSFGHSEP